MTRRSSPRVVDRSSIAAATSGAALLLATSAAPADRTISGLWVEVGPRTAFHFEPCGVATCATLVGSIYIKADADARDVKNPDPTLRDRRLKGLTILHDLKPSTNGWAGSIYIPSMGRTFAVDLRRLAKTKLAMTVCMAPQDCHTAILEKT